MIAIFADSTDVHADAVERVAQSRGSEVGRLNWDETHRWGFDFLCGEPLLTLDGRTFPADRIRSVFVRRLPDKQSFEQLSINAPSEAHDYVATQRLTLISDCVALLSERTRVINTLCSTHRAQSKASQLFVADKIGFCTPQTYSGANPTLARQHINQIVQTGSRVCTKPIAKALLTLDGQKHTRFTEILDRSDFADLETLNECPLTFQNYIEKSYEVRVTVVGDRIFACKIDSQKAGNDTAIDWRRYNIPRTPHSKYELPRNIQEMLLRFHSYFGLTVSSFDIIRSRQGDFVFLETNPYSQWLWIEDLTGLQITAAITDALLQ
jgi:hypothetical protein